MSIPPIPTADQSDDDNAHLLMAVLPALARVLIELPREDQRVANFYPLCPARVTLERLVGQEIGLTVSKPDHKRFIRLSRLVAYALEVADEVQQLDGKPAIDFAAGYMAGEKSTHELFSGPEIEKQALADAIEQSPLRASEASPFVLGFQTRRDQRRAAAADGKESA